MARKNIFIQSDKTNARIWTNDELDFIKNNYGRLLDQEIADKFDCTLKSVKSLALYLQLKKVGKICPYCSIFKEVSEYDTCKSRNDGLFTVCKQCRSETNRTRYSNTGYSKNRKLGERVLNRIKLSGCAFCKESEPCCLQFHHKYRLNKQNEVNKLVYNLTKMLKEIEKCILVCSNCHYKIHSNIIDDSKTPTINKEYLISILENMNLADENLEGYKQMAAD